jgi:signal transduction histidine kinase
MLTDKTLQLITGVAEKKQISVTVDLPKDLPYLWADMRLVDRVLQNLFNNAIKFTPKGGTIRLCAQFDELHPERALISVFNSGPGIPVDIKSRLFQKFVRGRQKEQGSGLGLAFCRLVVEAHDGHIWVESEPGQGATFYFTLPLHQVSN